jgi:uncharacterized protein YjiK
MGKKIDEKADAKKSPKAGDEKDKSKKDKSKKDKSKKDKSKKDKSKKDKSKKDKSKKDKSKKDKDKSKDEKHKSKDEKHKSNDEKHKSKDEKRKSKDEKRKSKDEKRKSNDEKHKSKKHESKAQKAQKARAQKAQKAQKAPTAQKAQKAAKAASKEERRIPLTLLEEVSLGLRSASAIAPIGGGRALVVDDDEGLYLVEADGRAEHLAGREHAEALGDLESLCTSDDGKTAYAVAEESGEVLALAVKKRGQHVTLSSPHTLGTLVRPGDTENKGWEGACFLAKTSERGPCLVVAHEREPMALAVYALPALTLRASIPIDETPLGALIDDVADVAVCPSTDHLFLLSDQSHRIVETRLDVERASLEVLATFDLSLGKKDKPEGIAFESPDRLVVVTDDPSRLLRFALG